MTLTLTVDTDNASGRIQVQNSSQVKGAGFGDFDTGSSKDLTQTIGNGLGNAQLEWGDGVVNSLNYDYDVPPTLGSQNVCAASGFITTG